MFAIAAIIVAAAGYGLFYFWKYRAQIDGAPYVALDPSVVEAALHLAEVSEDDIVYDLGSGDGRVPIMAALQHGAHAVGIEIDKLRWLYSRFQAFILGLSKQVNFLQKDLFKVNLSDATVVFMYLLQETNDALEEKLLKELKPGTRIVSAAFNFPDWEPIKVDEVHSTPYGPLYLYEVGVSNPKQ